MHRTIRTVLFSLALFGLALSLDACQDTSSNERSGAGQHSGTSQQPSPRAPLGTAEKSSAESTPSSAEERPCGTHNGHTLYIGPKGGCYYYNSNGKKSYVDKKECDC